MTHHPDLHLIDVRCSTCGTSFTTRSTATRLSIDVCSACHPAYSRRRAGRGQKRPDRPLQPAPGSGRLGWSAAWPRQDFAITLTGMPTSAKSYVQRATATA